MHSTRLRLPMLCLVLALAGPALAGDGVLEINQTVVDSAGGFPYTIVAPGNYVLTGSLTVPADTHALVLETSGVVIDLNGFSILGPFSCLSGACATGTGSAVHPGFSVAHGRETTLRNGRVGGFGSHCVSLNSSALVTGLMVSDCGQTGIGVGSGSIVSNNRVTRTGEYGIQMIGLAHPPTFERNAVSFAGLGGGSFSAVVGGKPSAGNSCDDESCSPTGKRSFYLSLTLGNGQELGAKCVAGFHLAQLSEIWDPSSLYYAGSRGLERANVPGPPMGSKGWLDAGDSDNCTNYTGLAGLGTVAELVLVSNSPTWEVVTDGCNFTYRFWCVED